MSIMERSGGSLRDEEARWGDILRIKIKIKRERERDRGTDEERERVCEREVDIEKDKDRESAGVINRDREDQFSADFLSLPFIFRDSAIPPRYFAKINSIPCLLTIGRSLVRPKDARNRRTQSSRPTRREVRYKLTTYVCTYRIVYAWINFIQAKC